MFGVLSCIVWEIKCADLNPPERTSGDSRVGGAPGPDVISSATWRSLGDLGVDILHDVAKDMIDSGFSNIVRKASPTAWRRAMAST